MRGPFLGWPTLGWVRQRVKQEKIQTRGWRVDKPGSRLGWGSLAGFSLIARPAPAYPKKTLKWGVGWRAGVYIDAAFEFELQWSRVVESRDVTFEFRVSGFGFKKGLG